LSSRRAWSLPAAATLRMIPLPIFRTAPAPPHLSTLSLHDALPISSGDPEQVDAALRRLWQFRVPFQARHVLAGRQAVLHLRDHRSEEHTSELQSRFDLVCRLLLEKKNRRETASKHSPNAQRRHAGA